jgi:uncharacterized membrane protein YkvA (DUF1232 family)
MQNRFFDMAIAQAARLAGKPGRLLKVVTQMLFRLDRTHLSGKRWKEHALLLGRLVSAYARGQYRAIPLKPFLSVVAALLYFINPFDLVPDALIGIGLADDLAVLTWVYKNLKAELDNFKSWEEKNLTVYHPAS